jgi:hypothetical protein
MGQTEQPFVDFEQELQRRGDAVRLGDVVRQLMEETIEPQQAVFQAIDQAWSALLPQELRRHCRIVDVADGQIKVQVDSPVYIYELRSCSSELKDELARLCPQARIKQIKLSIG